MADSTPESHLDPTAEINLDTVKKRAISGVAALTGRMLLSRFISVFAQGLLWLFIDPAEFGVFLLVSAVVNFLSYFADIGLGAALIQKKEKPGKEDFSTVFVVQELLVLSVVLILFFVSPILVRVNSLSNDARILLYALNISFFMASLKNIPSIMLERNLEFGKLVLPGLLEDIVYSTSVVFFAWRGFGISSFTYAVLLRGIVGLVSIYLLKPWTPNLAFSRKSFNNLLKYGIPYQLNSFLATIKDDGMTIYLGKILGTYGLGILGTAQKLSQYPLRFFVDPVNKVTFPAFSRMQDDKADLSRSLTRSIFFTCALVFPSLAGLITLFPVIISVIPKYQKWEPAFIPMVLLSLSSLLAASTTQLTNFLASIGKIKVVLKMMILWTSLTWLMLPFFSKNWGINGAAGAYAIIGSTSLIVIYIVKKMINWSVKDSVIIPLIASGVMGLSLFIFQKVYFSSNPIYLFVLVLFGLFIYALTMYVIIGPSIIDDVKKIIVEFSKKQT